MTCPMFVDFTRECIKKYPEIVKISSYVICESDGYEKCVVYNMIKMPDKNCKYSVPCYIDFFEKQLELTMEEITKSGEQFCFNKENRVNCSRYKCLDEGKEISIGLTADGRIVELKV